ncbi:NEDD4-binding protein 3 [Tachyglossus aculeatus]|uniref:NEDD4-binding protein 3 n=1 Tax=Tachyglossus aculeatus TaxID=9261 RepID=UPI0018F35AE3|nr:NEDD4-binding protein 3 [Tachyglossus aculeatus]
MATVLGPPANSDPGNSLLSAFGSRAGQPAMGSVGSLIEKQDFSPEELRAAFGGSRGPRQPDGLLKRGLGQRELLSYLHLAKRDPKGEKRFPAASQAFRRDYGVDGELEADYQGIYYRDHSRAADFTKTSLPERGRFDKCRIRPSVFKPVAGKSFLSMQSLSASKGQKLWKSNGSLHTLVCNPPVSPCNGGAGPASRPGPPRAHLLHTISLDQEGPAGPSDCGGPPPVAAQSQLSASVGHLNRIGGSLDRGSRGLRDPLAGAEQGPPATLGRLQGAGEPPPPYEFAYSVEEVVKQLEDRLQDKGGELQQLKRSLSDENGQDPFTQVLEDKQRLWMDELEELKQMYVEKLHEVSQKAQRSERSLQLQLFIAQQEKKRLRKELSAQQGSAEDPRGARPTGDHVPPKLEETKWEVCQKTAEISLLKQQLREAQAETARKLAEIFSLKTQLRGSRAEVEAKDCELARLRDSVRALRDPETRDAGSPAPAAAGQDVPGGEAEAEEEGGREERLRAELRREREQGRERALLFERERRTWQEEKDKVLRYQREIQVSYMEMYHRNQALERQLRELRTPPPPEPDSPWIQRVASSEI